LTDVQNDSVRALVSELLTVVVFILALGDGDWDFFSGSLNNWNLLKNRCFFDGSREGWSIEWSQICLFSWNRSRSDLLDLNWLLNLNLGAAEATSARAKVLDRSVVTD
jgi:hypothetical protein